ncbi:unnamed protein product [Rhodiola kirilowii]
MEKRVNFELRYGGQFTDDSDFQYVGGEKELLKGVDPDYISIMELKDVAVSAGYSDVAAIYYKFPKTNLTFRHKLVTDLDVNDMTDMMYDGDLVEIYVEHEANQNVKTGALILASDVTEMSSSQVLATDDDQNTGQAEGNIAKINHVIDECEAENVAEVVIAAENLEAFDNVCNNGSCDKRDKIDDELTDFSDPEMEQDNDDLFCEEDEKIEQARIHISKSLNEIFSTSASLCGKIDDDVDYPPSDDLISDFSEDEHGQIEYPFFNEKTDFGKNITLAVGMQFQSKEVFRSALKEFSIWKGFDFDYINNKKDRISAQCTTETCPWRIHASQQVDKNGDICFQIKSMCPHDALTCVRDCTGSRLSSEYLAEYYLEAFRDNPNWDIKAFKLHVKREFAVEVTYKKCWRAKKRALTIIEGYVGEQYKLLKDYCAALKQFNSGSSVYLTTNAGHFQRIYICLDACKRGFLTGCRPIISLDACHLKGAYNGQIHSAIGRDGNDNMFPIAYGICESESKESWLWFLENLLNDIGNSRDNGWCFISDQQKGLQEAIKELAPTSDHRFCVRHLYANFRKVFKGKQLKDGMWACARATTATVAQFHKAMENVKGLDKDAYTYLSKIDPAAWSRHGFSYFVKSDALCSNISECFNSFIRVARDQPIITCLETIQKLLMKRFYDKRTGMEKYDGDICPRIWTKLELNKRDSMHCNVYYGGGPAMEVEHTTQGTSVSDLASRSCTCRIWDLTGIPCSHACAAIRHMRGNPADYVHQSYRKSEFLKAYESYISPIPGPSEWPRQGGEDVLPPTYKRQAGRPRRRRIREADGPANPNRKRKDGIVMTYTLANI